MDVYDYVTRSQGLGFKLVKGFSMLWGLEGSPIMLGSTDGELDDIYKPELFFDQDNPRTQYNREPNNIE